MNTKSTGTGWTTIEMLGLVVVALGVAFTAYAVYNYFSMPAFPHQLGSIANNTAGNGQIGTGNIGYGGPGGGEICTSSGCSNYTGGSLPSGSTGFFSIDPLSRYSEMLSGVLMLLLGFVTFKYGGLKRIR